MLLQHRDDVDQGGVVDPCLLSVNGEDFGPNGRRGGSGVCPGVASRSALVDVGRSVRLEKEVFPSRFFLREEDM